MPLMPSRTKYRKTQRRRNRGTAKGGDTLAFGEFGIQSLGRGLLTAAQIEAARVAINRYLSRRGKVWIRVFPHKPITAKPAEVRMGSGKGEPAYWAAAVKPGTMLYEIGGLPEDVAKQALNRVAHKLPIRTRLLKRRAHV